ncbi:hypothetical protein HW130_14285 [Streptomyces sp. PKU-EA00015]|nr:hypothetical protein [Streptomyces sp. PKU-EA00015]
MPKAALSDAPAVTIRDPAELLDVDVDRFARPVAFVAADDLVGGPLQEHHRGPARCEPRRPASGSRTCAGRPVRRRTEYAWNGDDRVPPA